MNWKIFAQRIRRNKNLNGKLDVENALDNVIVWAKNQYKLL